jgi:hypothetical protein
MMKTGLSLVALTLVIVAGVSQAQPQQNTNAFWPSVQKTCDATAAKAPGNLAKDIAQRALNEHYLVGGHQIDSDGRLFRFGVVEAEQEEDDGGDDKARLRNLGWWQVLKYWRSLYGSTASVANNLEAWGYRGASTMQAGNKALTEDDETTGVQVDLARLLDIADRVSNDAAKEVLREAAIRASLIDNAWSAAFSSYVVRQAGITEKNKFQQSAAHHNYIYDAFATSLAETRNEADAHLYRACPIFNTRPRVGDMVCYQRMPSLAKATDAEVRERVLNEASAKNPHSVTKTHCDVVVHVDAKAAKTYVVGGNVQQSVTVKKLRLSGGSLKFSKTQSGMQIGDKIGCADWTLPPPSSNIPLAPTFNDKCSLNDKKWFVLLQMR